MSERTEIRNLYHVRTAKGFTLDALAQAVRKVDPRAANRSTLTDLENCRHNGSVRTLKALAQVLDTPIEDLIRIVPSEKKPRGRAQHAVHPASP